MKTTLLLITIFFLINGQAWTQEDYEPEVQITCGSEDNYKSAQYLGDRYEAAYQKAVTNFYNNGIRVNKDGEMFTIPTVVHIIHDGAPLGTDVNRTDAQIISQIQQASDRFRHQQSGADSYTNPNYGADTEIELCLAKLDPNGSYTSGVLRYYDPENTIDPSFEYMNNLAWDKSRYNNIFIARDIGGACGYYNGSFTVYLASCFNPGLTAHEMGHYFSLGHTFTGSCKNDDCLDDGDRVCDTPPKPSAGTNGGTCDAPLNSCTSDDDDLSTNNPYRPVANGGLGDQPDMYANYMDYTGSCWDAFTLGQKVRMHFNLTTNREALYGNAAACSGPAMSAHDAGVTTITIEQDNVCDKSIMVSAIVNNYGLEVLTSVTVDVLIDGVVRTSQDFSSLDITSSANSLLVINTPVILSATDKLLEVRTRIPNNMADANTHNDGNYNSVNYIGGDYCSSFSACADFNSATADGPGNMTLINVSDNFPELPSGASSIELCVSVQGDANWRAEVFYIITESMDTIGVTNFDVDCDAPTPQKCFVISAATYNTMKADGIISINLDPVSDQINPNLCNTNNGCIYISVPQNDACDADAFPSLDGPYEDEYSAAQYIRALGPIETGQSVIFQAGDSVIFKSPFAVSADAQLQVVIEDCDN